MAFLRSSSKAAAPPNYVGVQIQTSSEGMVLPVMYGANRTAPNLIWADNFQQGKGGKKGGGGGKGGGKSGSSVTYYSGCILAVCEGPVNYGIIFVDDTTYTSLSALNLVAYNGTATQTPFGCISTLPGFVPIAYRNVAYLATNTYDLGSSATLPQHNFEIYGFCVGYSSTLLPDVNPATVILDLCTNTRYGLAIPFSLIADLTQYQTYCSALNLLISPALDKQEQAISILQRWAQLTNSWIFFSENQLKIVPLGDSTVSGNGVTYTPNNTILYDLSYEDFIAEKDQPPLSVQRQEPSKAYNWVKIDCRDRINQYSSRTIEYKDQTSIEKFGLFQANSITADEVCVPDIAATMVGLIGARANYIRNSYKFSLSYNFVLLEPGDIVSLSDSALGLSRYPVRIRSISEDDKGALAIEAEECPSGSGTGIVMGTQTGGTVYPPAADVDPGPVNPPAIFEPPASVTANVAQVWIGASGGRYWGGATVYLSIDDVTYVAMGTLSTPTPQGVLLSALPISADPDTTDTLSIDLSESLVVLTASVTDADADAGRSLALLGAELLSYGRVVPNATNAYASDLSYLRRGFYGTSIAAHAIGAAFSAIVPANMLQIDLPLAYVGKTIYVKLASYNIFGAGAQDVSSVVRYSYTPSGVVYTIAPPSAASLAITTPAGAAAIALSLTWTASPGPSLGSYEVQLSADDGSTWTAADSSLSASATTFTLASAIPAATYQGRVRAISITGLATSAWATSAALNAGALVSDVPAMPAGLVVTALAGGFRMDWTNSTDTTIRAYQVWIASGAGQPFSAASLLVTYAAPASSITITGEPPIALSVYLVAVNAAGSSLPAG